MGQRCPDRSGNGGERKKKNGKATETAETQQRTAGARRDQSGSIADDHQLVKLAKTLVTWCLTLFPLPFRFGRSVHSRCPTGFLHDCGCTLNGSMWIRSSALAFHRSTAPPSFQQPIP